MKVLLVNAFDRAGGAARAAYRLHQGLRRRGVHSRLLVQEKSGGDWTVLGPETTRAKAASKLRLHLDTLPVRQYKARINSIFSPAWVPSSAVLRMINQSDADVVHLHWIAAGMLRIEDLARIKKPIVWTLHDNWGFTGGCHIMWTCDRYKAGCGWCPALGSTKKFDLSRRVFARKASVFPRADLRCVTTPSSWLAERTRESVLLGSRRIKVLANPIDTEVFKPFPKSQARSLLNLPQDKRLVAFGAVNAVGDPNKGFAELASAIEHSSWPADTELLIFGAMEPEHPTITRYRTHYLGHLHDDATLCALYSAADVMVVPSRQEAFGQTAAEAMACGTPVVAFAATGLLDVVNHHDNGYLAKPFSASDLSKGIRWVLTHPEPESLAISARRKVEESFELVAVAKKFEDLYREIVARRKQTA